MASVLTLPRRGEQRSIKLFFTIGLSADRKGKRGFLLCGCRMCIRIFVLSAPLLEKPCYYFMEVF